MNNGDKEEAFARNSDPWTSHEAADFMEDHVAGLKADILVVLKEQQMTTVEIATCLHKMPWSISPRMLPLEKKGHVQRFGTKRNPSGRRAIIWGLADKNGSDAQACEAVQQIIQENTSDQRELTGEELIAQAEAGRWLPFERK